MKKIFFAISFIFVLVVAGNVTITNAQTFGGVNKTWSIRNLQNTYVVPQQGVCGVSIIDPATQIVGCLVPMHIFGIDPFLNGVCAVTAPYAPMGQRYLDSPSLRQNAWYADKCGGNPTNTDPCTHGWTMENVDVFPQGDGCPKSPAVGDGGVIQAIAPFSLAYNDFADWGSFQPAGVPAGQLDAQWGHAMTGETESMYSYYYGAVIFGTVGTGFGITTVYTGPQIISITIGGPNDGSCTFDAPSSLSTNYLTNQWGTQGRSSQWTLPGLYSDPSTQCGSMMASNTVPYTGLIQVTMDNYVNPGDEGSVLIAHRTPGDYKITGMFIAVNAQNTRSIYMDDISAIIGALDNEGRTAKGLGSIFNWKIFNPDYPLVNAPLALNATAESIPAEELSRQTEEQRIPSSVYTDVLNLHDKGHITTMRYDVHNQTWHVGVVNGCPGTPASALLQRQIQDKLRPWTSAQIVIESGELITSTISNKGIKFAGCK